MICDPVFPIDTWAGSGCDIHEDGFCVLLYMNTSTCESRQQLALHPIHLLKGLKAPRKAERSHSRMLLYFIPIDTKWNLKAGKHDCRSMNFGNNI